MRWFRTENGLVARQLGREDVQVKESDTGRYTPVVQLSSNFGTVTTYENLWYRTGDYVTVAGRVDANPSTSGAWSFDINLPVEPDEDFPNNEDYGGGSASTNTNEVFAAFILPEIGSKNMRFAGFTNNPVVAAYGFTFVYRLR